MARRAEFKLTGVTTWIKEIQKGIAKEVAEDIAYDLKAAGPYWTGEFEEGWRVKLGSSGFRASQPSAFTREERRDTSLPFNRQITPLPNVPTAPDGRKNIYYSIGNIMEYRDIALDLKPGRFDSNKRNTTEQDWYVRYVEGGPLQRRLAESTNKVSKNPLIRGYKGLADARARINATDYGDWKQIF